jgi:AcrR family transcriptional regulator
VTRADLLLAGRKLFSEKGLYLSRVEDLTRRAGIAKGTLYQYFRNKEDLIQAVVESGFGELEDLVERRTRGIRNGDQLMRGIIEAHIEFLATNPDLMRIFHQVRGVLKFNGAGTASLRRTICRHLDGLADRMSGVPWAGRSHASRRDLADVLFGSVSGAISVRASTRPRMGLLPSRTALSLALVTMAKVYARSPGVATQASRVRRVGGVLKR